MDNTSTSLQVPPSTSSVNWQHVSETDIDPALLHAACIPTQTPSGEKIPKEQFEAQLYIYIFSPTAKGSLFVSLLCMTTLANA